MTWLSCSCWSDIDAIPNLVSGVRSQASHRETFRALGEDGWTPDSGQRDQRGPFPRILGASLLMNAGLGLRRRQRLSARSVQSQEDQLDPGDPLSGTPPRLSFVYFLCHALPGILSCLVYFDLSDYLIISFPQMYIHSSKLDFV